MVWGFGLDTSGFWFDCDESPGQGGAGHRTRKLKTPMLSDINEHEDVHRVWAAFKRIIFAIAERATRSDMETENHPTSPSPRIHQGWSV